MSRATTALTLAGVLAFAGVSAAGSVAFNHWWLTTPTATPQPVAVSEPAPTLEACVTEDSEDCYWDASEHGNGQGTDLINWHGQTYTPQGTGWAELRTVTLGGTDWPYVDGLDGILYCTAPLEVGIDVDDQGNTWAGCM